MVNVFVFVQRLLCAVFVGVALSEFPVCRSFVVFLFEWRWGKWKCFVELAWLNFLFNVWLAQFFVGAVLSRFPVGLSPFFV